MTGFLPKTLSELFAELHYSVNIPVTPVRVTGIALDSRSVQPGNLFVALKGESVDGHRFIPDALKRGAAAVVGTQPGLELAVPYLQVEDSREALAYLAAAFYNYPARQLTVIGVTGTDGKTTTANLIYQILLAAGLQCGIISTVNATIGKEVVDTGFHVTTPEAPEVQRFLSRMISQGLTHVVLEATSHGLAQHRVTGCEFDVGVVTNITHEHLDYHGSYEAYRAAKARLFTGLAHTHAKAQGNPRLAVLNQDDASYAYLAEVSDVNQASYSLLFDNADLLARDIVYKPGGLSFTAVGPNFTERIHTPLVGDYNVSNCLAALAATMIGLGIPAEAARQGIAALPGIPGRMERIDMGQNFTAIVDFAHTPNALRRALQTVRHMTDGRVLAVFGSAGLRDRQKRRLMAEVSAELADVTFLTAEDPRTEALEDILAEMAEGARAKGGVEGETFWRISDRGKPCARRFAWPGRETW